MRRRIVSSLVLALSLACSGVAMATPAVTVAIDHATRLQLSRPAGSVIVGNPAVADVSVVDHRTLYVSGRGYGVSQVLVLDPLGRPIWQGDVVVTQGSQGAVSVYRGAQVTEMACAAACAPTVRSAAAKGGGAINPQLPAPAGAPQVGPITP